MSALINLQAHANGTAVVPAPLLRKKATAKQKVTAGDESTESVVTKLAAIRERYLAEMQTARDRVKKNFLR